MDLNDARKLLLDLNAERLPFVIIGSLGLHLLLPRALEREPKDIDLLIPNQKKSLTLLVEWLRDRGFLVTSWEDPIAAPLPFAKLRGRFYLRARKAETVLDATYECEYLTFEQAWAGRHRVSGLPVAAIEHIARLLRARGKPLDLARLDRIETLLGRPPGFHSLSEILP